MADKMNVHIYGVCGNAWPIKDNAQSLTGFVDPSGLLFSGFQALRRGLRKQHFGDFASKRPFKTKKVASEARFGAKLAPQTGPKSLPKRSTIKSNFQSKFGTAPEGHLDRKMG